MPYDKPIEELEAMRLLVEQCRYIVVTQGQNAFTAIDAAEARRQADRLDLLVKAESSLNDFEGVLRAFPELFEAAPVSSPTDQGVTFSREVRNASVIAEENLGEEVTIEKDYAQARGFWDGRRFVIAAGSEMRVDEVPSIHTWIRRHRKELIENGIVERRGRAYVFLQPAAFTSPSAAAGVVMGRSANGPQEWRLASGQPLGDLEPKVFEGDPR